MNSLADQAAAPAEWRRLLADAVAAQDLGGLEARLAAEEQTTAVRVRRSVLLRRLGRSAEAQALIAQDPHPLAVAQAALNDLETCPPAEREAWARVLLARLPERWPKGDVTPGVLEARARLEVARGTAYRHAGHPDQATLCFARAGVLAEMYGDERFAEQAQMELRALRTGRDRVDDLHAALERELARPVADDVQLRGAAERLVDAAWEEGDTARITAGMAQLPEDHPTRLAYLAFVASSSGDAPPELPGAAHPIYFIARLGHAVTLALRAADRTDFGEARALARAALAEPFSPASSAFVRGTVLLLHARAYVLLAQPAEAEAALLEAEGLLHREEVSVMQATLSAFRIEGWVWQAEWPAESLMQTHLRRLVAFMRGAAPDQAERLAATLAVFAPHALNVANAHLSNPRVLALSTRVLLISRKDLLRAFATATPLTPRVRAAHLAKLLAGGGHPRRILLRPRVDRLRAIPLWSVPDESGELST